MALPQAIHDQWFERLSPVWPHFTQIEVDHANGVYLTDRSGRRYLDFTSGIGVTNTGHCHPRVVKAIQDQAQKLLHGQITIVYHRPLRELVEVLQTVVPSNLNSFFFTNSGSEAVESAMKLARHATSRSNIIAFQGGYHGRTVGAMSITTAKTVYRTHYQPLMPGVLIAPFPYSYRYGKEPDELADWCLKELRHLLDTQTAPNETAAMIIEPVLGEGGYVIPPIRFMQGLRELCDEHKILLIFDEVQSGFGRTGRFFALEHFDVCPDILVMAKGLGSGLPISGIAASRGLMERWIPGSHGGTYGGNAIAAAAAAETIRVLKDENLTANAEIQGTFLRKRLSVLQKRFACMAEVRGLGLMVGCEFGTPDGKPDRAVARRVRELCLANGLLLLTCGTHDQVVRWIPPLIVTQRQLEEALSIFESALDRVKSQTS